MGTLMPTPRVSVPEMTRRMPLRASRSTRRRYFGSIPAWWTPTPWRRRRRSVWPKPLEKENPLISSAMRAFWSFVARSTESSPVASSMAPFWE
ncbi:Uncharacterised protein [Mycobacteroides abscessus subsp. abscessus]|nr:Uncharacterised protein [Mycobacteroides abscessus subsp. abscessus]